LRSFQTRVSLLLIGGMLFTALLSDLLIYRLALNAQFDQLREQLLSMAKTAALSVDAYQLERIPLAPEGVNTPEFRSIAQGLLRIKSVNPRIKYIYTMVRGDRPGLLRFVVDPVALTAEERRKKLSSSPGTRYNAARFPEMLGAFNYAQADRRLSVDEWGVTLSGYAPIRDVQGRPMAIIGVDMDAKDVYALQRKVWQRAVAVLAISVLLSLLLSMMIAQRVSKPIRRLVDGIRHVGREEMFRVRVEGSDEIKELADSFNDMASSLYKSRRRLHTYFYRSVQTLISIMEARDKYTKGHSERVAEYAAKIGIRLQLPPEQVELLRETAVLHDIGKLGIEERILHKKEKLTDEEWDKIRRHPIIGEEILAPILLNKELISIVRSHHERYDGQGYPDRLAGASIKLFAQILTVADSYDAMTSPRSYRPAMHMDKAIDELVSNRGSHFAPRIVDVFVELLNEEIKNGKT
ncbi:MAG: HD domain-containing phosphohydrolase, partial [Deltaproteobacteria bacterium]